MHIASFETAAPACFGAPSIYSFTSQVCGACKHNTACAEEARVVLERIRDRVNVSDLLKLHDKAGTPHQARPNATQAAVAKVERTAPVEPVTVDISPDEKAICERLNIKPAALAQNLCRKGMIARMRADFSARRNPFSDDRQKWLRVASDCLLKGYSRQSLKQSFEAELGWSGQTASSHVSIVTPVFIAFGFAKEVDGRVMLAEMGGSN